MTKNPINKKELQKFTEENIKELSLMSLRCLNSGITIDEIKSVLLKLAKDREDSLKQNPK